MQSPASFFEGVLRFVLESSPVAMITCDENGLIRSASPQAEHILGYNRDELLGRSVESLVPMGARQRHASLRHSFAESRSLRAMGSGRNLWALRRDGSSIPVEIGLAPLMIDNGLIILATLVDISERQAAENALAGDFAQSNGNGDFAARVEAVLRCVPDGAVAIDKEGFIKTANRSARELFGYGSGELQGLSITCLLASLDLNRLSLAQDLAFKEEADGQRKNGTSFPARIFIKSLDAPVVEKWLVVFVHDLTEQRRIEARTKQLIAEHAAAIGRTAVAVVHEISQPIFATTTYLDVAMRLMKMPRELRPASVEDALNNAMAQMRRAAGILNYLRRFIAGGEPDQTRQSLHLLINEVLTAAANAAADAGVEVRTDLSAPDDIVLVDAVQLKYVIENLVQNAFDSMLRSSEKTLTLATVNVEGMIRVDVTDTGAGISREQIGKLFEPFTATKATGMGLGLSVARRIIDAHHGAIWTEPGKECGATFTLTLPLAHTAA